MNPASAVARPFVAIGCLLLLGVSSFGAEKVKSLSPGEALQAFRVAPGMRVELVAAEPLVASPCAIAFDAKGRLFVAENRGYPIGPKVGEKPAGVIAMLEDTDDDTGIALFFRIAVFYAKFHVLFLKYKIHLLYTTPL